MQAYVYQAALYCENCIKPIKTALHSVGVESSQDDATTYDSDDYPQGPDDDGGGEADSPQHCDGCRIFLENPLTDDGVQYVILQLFLDVEMGRGSETVEQWRTFYAESVYS